MKHFPKKLIEIVLKHLERCDYPSLLSKYLNQTAYLITLFTGCLLLAWLILEP
jgi:hypothetical protein